MGLTAALTRSILTLPLQCLSRARLPTFRPTQRLPLFPPLPPPRLLFILQQLQRRLLSLLHRLQFRRPFTQCRLRRQLLSLPLRPQLRPRVLSPLPSTPLPCRLSPAVHQLSLTAPAIQLCSLLSLLLFQPPSAPSPLLRPLRKVCLLPKSPIPTRLSLPLRLSIPFRLVSLRQVREDTAFPLPVPLFQGTAFPVQFPARLLFRTPVFFPSA